MRPGIWLSTVFAIELIAPGCSATTAPSDVPYKAYAERAETQTQNGLSVTAGILTAEEARTVYGVDLAGQLMQPVWIEVRNDTGHPYWLLASGLDPNHFSASEAAYAFRTSDPGDGSIGRRFDALAFRNPIMPGAKVSGFVLANLDEGVKVVDIDLVGRHDAESFTFIATDPTFKGTSNRVDFGSLYREDELIQVEDDGQLRALLEGLPCCTTNAEGDELGDPLNLVLIGTFRDIAGAMVRRGWHPTEIISAESIWRTIAAFLRGSRYRYSPISPLHVFSRPQDIAAQKSRSTIHERNHARFWLTPIRYRGQPVFVGQISRDIGVKYTLKSPTISTHKIDADVDEARRYLLEDLAYSQALYRFGFVKGVGAAGRQSPRMNLVGDPYYTDGLRAVLFIAPRPLSLSDIDIVDWESPPAPELPVSESSSDAE
jgi:LssY C-terminus